MHDEYVTIWQKPAPNLPWTIVRSYPRHYVETLETEGQLTRHFADKEYCILPQGQNPNKQ